MRACTFQLFFQFGDPPVGKLASLGQIAFALGLLQFKARRIELFLDPAFRMDLVTLVLPAGGELRRFLLKVRQLFAKSDKTILRCIVAFLGQRRFFDFQLDNAAVEILDLFRL